MEPIGRTLRDLEFGNGGISPDAPAGGTGPGRCVAPNPWQSSPFATPVSGWGGFTPAPTPGAQRKPAPAAAAATSAGLTVEQVATIMNHKGWTRGERLLRRWMDAKAHTAPDYAPASTAIITMAWVMGFQRAREVVDAILGEKVYRNDAARRRLTQILNRQHKFGPKCSVFDFIAGSVEANDAAGLFVNERVAGSQTDDPDDMVAALGRFTLRVTVSGEVRGKTVEIRKVGVYVRDSYDFNDDPVSWTDPRTWISQPLGYWNPETDYAGMNPLRGSLFNNRTAQDHRKRTGMGGDFLVFSDVREVTLDPPETFVANVVLPGEEPGKSSAR